MFNLKPHLLQERKKNVAPTFLPNSHLRRVEGKGLTDTAQIPNPNAGHRGNIENIMSKFLPARGEGFQGKNALHRVWTTFYHKRDE